MSRFVVSVLHSLGFRECFKVTAFKERAGLEFKVKQVLIHRELSRLAGHGERKRQVLGAWHVYPQRVVSNKHWIDLNHAIRAITPEDNRLCEQ